MPKVRRAHPNHLSWQALRVISIGLPDDCWTSDCSSSSGILPDRLRMPIMWNEIWRAKLPRETLSRNYPCAGIMAHRSLCFRAHLIIVDASREGSSKPTTNHKIHSISRRQTTSRISTRKPNPQPKPMSDKITNHPGKTSRLIRLILGIVVFGVLMGGREEFESRWQRSLVAASAFIILGFCVSQYRKSYAS